MPSVVRSLPSKLFLTVFADAGAFQDLGDRLRREFPNPKDAPRIDLLKVPESIVKELQSEFPEKKVEAPREGRILYNLGASSATTFLEKMEAEWSIQTLPLGMCRYERAATSTDGQIPPFRIRFHAPIAYALGYLAGKQDEQKANPPKRDQFVVVVVSDDPQLIPSLADARQCGLDVRLAWFTGSLSPETSHFCGRNGVPITFIDPVMMDSHAPTLRARDYGMSFLNDIANIAASRK